MELYHEEDVREEAITQVAQKMVIAARTAPKGRGIDNTAIAIVKGDGIRAISQKMKELVKQDKAPQFFERDADNILSSPVLVLLGTRIKSLGVQHCEMCGFENCDEKNKYPNHPCAFNTGDLGIAIGSAVSVAMNNRVDNRIMYSVGKAVVKMGLLGEDIKVAYGIPLSVSEKNPFFDRK
jgi:uncharacterized ferredoxin-like protein